MCFTILYTVSLVVLQSFDTSVFHIYRLHTFLPFLLYVSTSEVVLKTGDLYVPTSCKQSWNDIQIIISLHDFWI